MSNSLADQIAKGPFLPTWESLRTYQCPEWFRNAKFGIWAHWGPQCVPMCGDWYARRMYQPNDWLYHHHWRVYGHPSEFGYKDIIPLWKAESFDPEGLMDLYKAAGARYFVGQAVHHDNFDNWDSTHHRWNSTKVGPKKNISKLFEDAARKRGLRFGLSEHLGAAFSWNKYNKGADADGPYAGVPYDGNLREFEDLYLPNKGDANDWYTDNPWWHERWFARMKDVIDQHQPDLFYSDGGVPFGDVGLSLIAHLYNSSAAVRGMNEAVYNQKDTNPDVYRVGVLDIERGQRPDIAEYPWQTDTSVGDWYYDSRYAYKTPKHVVEMLVDIVSKNGNLLLNLPQRPDGTLDDECTDIARSLAAWFAANAEGIYDTRPWKVAGEGPATAEHGAFKENPIAWTIEDFRFTAKADTVYAFQMKQAEGGTAAIKALGANSGIEVDNVRVLGHDGPVSYDQAPQALVVRMPVQPGAIVPCVAVDLQ